MQGSHAEVIRLTQELAARDAPLSEQQQVQSAKQVVANSTADAESRAAAATAEADSLRQAVTEREAEVGTLEARLSGTEAALQAAQVGSDTYVVQLPTLMLVRHTMQTLDAGCRCPNGILFSPDNAASFVLQPAG